jgi:hypothetical protein
MGIIPAATATTAVIHIARITMVDGRTTTAIAITSIISITTATKQQVNVKLEGWLGAIQASFFLTSKELCYFATLTHD